MRGRARRAPREGSRGEDRSCPGRADLRVARGRYAGEPALPIGRPGRCRRRRKALRRASGTRRRLTGKDGRARRVPRVRWRLASESPTPSRSRAGHRSRRSATRRAGEAGRAGTYRPSMVRSPVQRSTARSPPHRSAATDRGAEDNGAVECFRGEIARGTPPCSAMRPPSCASCAQSSSSRSHRSAPQHSSPRTRGKRDRPGDAPLSACATTAPAARLYGVEAPSRAANRPRVAVYVLGPGASPGGADGQCPPPGARPAVSELRSTIASYRQLY
jgi:hypothetical protein